MTRTLLTAKFLASLSQTAWAENFDPMPGYTLEKVGNNRLFNFLNKQANPSALRQGYTKPLRVKRSIQEVEIRGLRCAKKWGALGLFKIRLTVK